MITVGMVVVIVGMIVCVGATVGMLAVMVVEATGVVGFVVASESDCVSDGLVHRFECSQLWAKQWLQCQL